MKYNTLKPNANYAENHIRKNTTDKHTAATNAEKKPKEDKTDKHGQNGSTKTEKPYTKNN